MEITALNQLDVSNGIYTYADYLLWKIKERVELFRGKVFAMSAPSPEHQEVSGNLNLALRIFFQNRQCAVYAAPFDVRLPKKNEKGDDIQTVVQPDLCVICDPKKIDDKGCLGAPDLVIEILSPSNSKKELKYKFDLYQEAGIQEYWVVSPEYESIIVYVLKEGKYVGLAPVVEGTEIVSYVFPNLKIAISKVFEKQF